MELDLQHGPDDLHLAAAGENDAAVTASVSADLLPHLGRLHRTHAQTQRRRTPALDSSALSLTDQNRLILAHR